MEGGSSRRRGRTGSPPWWVFPWRVFSSNCSLALTHTWVPCSIACSWVVPWGGPYRAVPEWSLPGFSWFPSCAVWGKGRCPADPRAFLPVGKTRASSLDSTGHLCGNGDVHGGHSNWQTWVFHRMNQVVVVNQAYGDWVWDLGMELRRRSRWCRSAATSYRGQLKSCRAAHHDERSSCNAGTPTRKALYRLSSGPSWVRSALRIVTGSPPASCPAIPWWGSWNLRSHPSIAGWECRCLLGFPPRLFPHWRLD